MLKTIGGGLETEEERELYHKIVADLNEGESNQLISLPHLSPGTLEQLLDDVSEVVGLEVDLEPKIEPVDHQVRIFLSYSNLILLTFLFRFRLEKSMGVICALWCYVEDPTVSCTGTWARLTTRMSCTSCSTL